MNRAVLCAVAISAACLISATRPAYSQTTAPPATATATESKPFTCEFYYKVKWGRLGEFLKLYKKNHFPILRKQQERGEILSISAEYPINHASEDSRWDLRITVTYRDAIVAHEDPSEAVWVKQMFPDQETYKREEQQRFELVLEHMDIPIAVDDVTKW
ncbi:MAG TPA: hypothetical protein VGQ76_05130 [Thermoanaerobaculia bacterium]|jgi:hypothetical protein|nr:hypothetical protein [Thermoanaerobaculia bacterium]